MPPPLNLLFLRRAVALAIDGWVILQFIAPDYLADVWFSEGSPELRFAGYSLGVALSTLYVVGFHARWGCTLGKKIMGLRVATMAGVWPLPLDVAFIRYVPDLCFFLLAVGAVYIPFLAYDVFGGDYTQLTVVEVLSLAWRLGDIGVALKTSGRRSLGDLIARTEVVGAGQLVPTSATSV